MGKLLICWLQIDTIESWVNLVKPFEVKAVDFPITNSLLVNLFWSMLPCSPWTLLEKKNTTFSDGVMDDFEWPIRPPNDKPPPECYE